VLLSPFTYLRFPGRLTLQYSTAIVGTFDRRENSQGQLEALTADAADPYATLRSVYLQSREAQVRGEDAAPVLPPIDEPAPTGAPAPSAQGPTGLTDPAAPATEPNIRPVQEAAASDMDAPMATAFPGDSDQSASRRFAAAN
jgi:phospholipid-binding lipoprotein MlaA